jgi:hypothetical protein
MAAIAKTTRVGGRPIVRVVIGSLIAGIVYGMWTMIVEAILHAGQDIAAGFFSPVTYIGATVQGGFNNPNFYPAGQLPPAEPVAIILGLMGHMMNSVILGLIFFWIASHLSQSRATLIVAGIVYAVLIFFIMEYALLPFVDPVMLRVNYVGFLLGHMMFGIGLGLTAISANRANA